MINEPTQIGKLSARGSVKNDPAFRLGLSSLLANTSFKPFNMPPSAVLIVRKMRDPLPGKLSAKTQQYLPDREWQSAINNQLNKIYKSAEKPKKGVLSGEEEVVVFADTAELIACYVSDIVNARTAQCWWWKTLKKLQPINSDVSATLLDVFIEDIEYLPAALVKLHTWHLAQPVIQSLQRHDALSLCVILAQEYALNDLHRVLSNKPGLSENKFQAAHNNAESPVQPRVTDGNNTNHVSRDGKCSQLQTLFRKTLAADISPEGSTVERVLLSGLCIILNQQPWLAKTCAFQNQLIEVIKDFNVSHEDNNNDESNKINNSAVLHQHEQRVKDVSDAVLNSPDNSTDNNKTPDTINTEVFDSQPGKEVTALNNAENSTDEELNNELDHELNDEQKKIFSEEGIITELGGVFYILNLISWLDIPACFENSTNPYSPASTDHNNLLNIIFQQMSPWALLYIISRHLLHKTIADFKDDAIWSILRELNGCDICAQIDNGFTEDYRLPESWFNNVYTDRETYRWAVKNDRLYMWAAADYMLVDITRSRDSAFAQADEVLRNYLGSKRSALLAKSSANNLPVDSCVLSEQFSHEYNQGHNLGLNSWMNYVMPFIRHQLKLVTGLNADELSAQLLQCRGQIYVTSNHIDLVAPLENISIAARRAGLDRDPGWLIEAGRVVLFHFD